LDINLQIIHYQFGEFIKKVREDRRIQKTRKALNEALLVLMEKKKYEWITIQDILDRANVGRSTFYLHYRDKDELLLDGLTNTWEEIIRTARTSASGSSVIYERIIAFSLPALKHAYGHKTLFKMLVGSNGWTIVRRRLEEVLIHAIKEAAGPFCKKRSISAESFEFFGYFLASGFLSVLTWWLNGKNPMSPEKMNELFREMVVPLLKAHHGYTVLQ
jgi:AcrR family transcriptional regulator